MNDQGAVDPRRQWRRLVSPSSIEPLSSRATAPAQSSSSNEITGVSPLVRSRIADLVLSRVIEGDRKTCSTCAEIFVLRQRMNPLRNDLIIRERSKSIFLQNVKFASVAAYYRARQVLKRFDEAFI